ncbi:MAG: CapA family protein [Leptolyngbyaceae cyanobacterium]
MVDATENLSSERLATKALAAAGQFRAIALWLNEPLVPQGVYAQVCQDKRPGCIRITLEFERTPLQKPLTQYVCHLMWQLNSPLIEGIHLLARPVGERQLAWQQRVRIVTPALKARLQRERGQAPPAAIIPPALVQGTALPRFPGFDLSKLTDQIKTLRPFMLTGSAVAAFVFGCMIEVVMSSKQEPALPFQAKQEANAVESGKAGLAPKAPSREPQLPEFQTDTKTVLADRPATGHAGQIDTAVATTSVSYKVQPERDRPNVVNAALEPVGVLKHERLSAPQDPTITLAFGGDVDLDGLPYGQLEYDGQLLSGLPGYRQADLAMVNLQDPLSRSATSLEEELLERQRPDAINLLKEGGVDLVNLTGEKALSYGEQGLAETLNTLDRNGIFRVGAGRSAREARRPEIVDVKGQRIAYLSYDRDFTLAAEADLSGVNAVAMKDIIQDIQAIRDEVDWLIVNYRWSTEPPATPAESQTNLARLAIDQGADLVVGHHPQKLQGAELYKGRPIAYSLGDFVFGQAAEAPTAETALLQVALRPGQMKVELVPVEVKAGQPQQASGPQAEQILAKIHAASQDFREPMPASVVLDVRPAGAADITPAEDDGFTAEEESSPAPSTAPAEQPLPEADLEAPPSEQAPPTDAAPPEPLPAETAPPDLETVPADSHDIEIEEFSDDLLKDWGPKDSPNTLYEPESSLPPDLQVAPSKSVPAPKQAPWRSPERTSPSRSDAPPASPSVPVAPPSATDNPPAPAHETVPAPPPDDAIGPYSEPLVGPISSLPETAPDMKLAQAPELPPAKAQPGMPEARIYTPLNPADSSSAEAVTEDIDLLEAIAQSEASPSPQPPPD